MSIASDPPVSGASAATESSDLLAGLRFRRTHTASRNRCRSRVLALGVLVACLTRAPVAAAHDGSTVAGLTRWHGVALALAGVGLVGGSVVLKRRGRLRPTRALPAAFAGLTAAVLGVVLFEGLSPDPRYAVATMPFPRSWYPLASLLGGTAIAVASLVVGRLRWPTRPRYAVLGVVLGLWVAYPSLVPDPTAHPLGYALVLGTPVAVGYVVRRDAWPALRRALADPASRRFGVGVAALTALFFMAVSGYLTVLPDAGAETAEAAAGAGTAASAGGTGTAQGATAVVLPVVYQLVAWPTLEVALPGAPVAVALSMGIVAVVGTLSALVGANAALVARRWRVEEQSGLLEGTAGTAAVAGSCTCGCCGPLVAKVAVLAAGPSVAAPLYWVFADPASPLGSLFVVGSVTLFTGSLVYSVSPSISA